MSATVAPSFCACFTLEFINTVQRVPRSIGFFAKRASFAKSRTLKFKDFAKGLNKRTTAGRTGLVQLNAVYGLILDLDALHILTTDI